jgi:hypothetical protein
MRQYLFLAAAFREFSAERVSIGETTVEPVLADERSLRVARPGHVTPFEVRAYGSWLQSFRQRNMAWLSWVGPAGGVVLLTRSGLEGYEELAVEKRMAREISILLGDVDVVEIKAPSGSGEFSIEGDIAGRTLAFSSSSSFSVQGRIAERVASSHGDFYVAIVDGTAAATWKSVELKTEGEIKIWAPVLPDFMSRNRFRERLDTSAGRRLAERLRR